MTEIDWYQNMEATLPTLRTKDIYHILGGDQTNYGQTETSRTK